MDIQKGPLFNSVEVSFSRTSKRGSCNQSCRPLSLFVHVVHIMRPPTSSQEYLPITFPG